MVVITILSIDVAIDADRCDLMKSASLATFTAAVYSRQVILSGGGPPCETWSASRWSDLPGPPPLRTHDEYWGIKLATARQRLQLLVGNALLQAMVLLMGAHLCAGSAAWMEHSIPAHWRAQAVTSWTWEPLLALQSCPVVSTTDFDQCEHGGTVGRAPTRIVGLRVKGLHARLTDTPGRGRCSHGRGAHTTLLGKKEDGVFRTAAKKVYPAGLCEALANAMVDTVADFAALEFDSQGQGAEARVPRWKVSGIFCGVGTGGGGGPRVGPGLLPSCLELSA